MGRGAYSSSCAKISKDVCSKYELSGGSGLCTFLVYGVCTFPKVNMIHKIASMKKNPVQSWLTVFVCKLFQL